MPRYKRTADEAQLDLPTAPQVAPEDVERLTKLRNMWELASLMQYIFLFGHIVKVDDDLDIEDLEAECLKSEPSAKLARIGLQLLKYVSSHRGLTPDIFDEYTRRQYVAKAPLRNPFGEDEKPTPFASMDIFTRIRILQQLSIWTLGNVERIRSMMPQDEDHLNWRMEPLGWDREDNAYYVLDDNRLYRRADVLARPLTPPPAPKAKAKSKAKKVSKSKATRSSKRRKVEESEDEAEAVADTEAGAQDDTTMVDADETLSPADEESSYGFTHKTWSLVAITLDEYDDFLSSIFRSRDPNEKQLHKRITDDVRPIIERREESLRAKQMKKLRELQNVQLIATAKRSSRLAGKAEKEKEERDAREVIEKRDRDLRMAHEEEERQRGIEEGHDSRRMTREQRVKEREVKRILHEEELQKIQEAEERAASASQAPPSEAADAEADRKRLSARQAQTQKEQHKKELAQLAAEETVGVGHKWYFDCAVCGMHGENLDDGTHSLACDRCGVWQHSHCHGFTPKQAEGKGFTFICKSCKKQEIAKEKDSKPKIPPLKLGRKAGGSESPQVTKSKRGSNGGGAGPSQSPSSSTGALPPHVQMQLDGLHHAPSPAQQPRPSPGPFGQLINNGPSLSPQGQAHGPPGYRYPPVGNFAPPPLQHAPQQPWQGSPLPPPLRPGSSQASGYASSPPPAHMTNGARPSPGYPASSPPQQHVPTQNGYRPQQALPHQQQHQYMHQQAIAASGAHPGYAPPPQQHGQQHFQHPQPNGYGGQHYGHPQSQQHNQQQYYQQTPQMQQLHQRRTSEQAAHQSQQQPQHQQHPHQQYAPPPEPLMNGFQSPVKTHAQPSQTPHQPSSAPQQHLQQHYAPQSSPAQFHAAPANAIAGRPAPNLTPTPQAHAQNASFSQQRPPSSNGHGMAADGMSGPWPAGSQGIPQKHDQPPASSPMIGEAKVMPAPGLAPSPRMLGREHGGSGGTAQVIPIKKAAPEVVNGNMAAPGAGSPEQGVGDGGV
ncbi:hypothetical protein LTR53_009515 [Teratosphaeriaceae sp. CCFEE 6253]|nr:hypothetical protein LTR53_009515 [Teratosphaeriaceae sp. CCFEE 6253]